MPATTTSAPATTNHASTASPDSSPARKSPSSQPPDSLPQRATGPAITSPVRCRAPLLTIFESDRYLLYGCHRLLTCSYALLAGYRPTPVRHISVRSRLQGGVTRGRTPLTSAVRW